MSADFGIGEALEEVAQAEFETGFLSIGARVGGSAAATTADVADTDAVFVIVQTMSAFRFEDSAWLKFARLGDDVVVAYAYPAFLLVPAVDVVHVEIGSDLRVGTVDDDVVDGSHIRFDFSIELSVIEKGAPKEI